MSHREFIELKELQAGIKEGVEASFPLPVWVKGEIGSWSPRANGHCYLNLTQSENGRVVADCRAMIWKWKFPALKAFFEETTGTQLKAGLTVLVKVEVSYSELYGVSLFIDDIDPSFTLGEKAEERKKSIERLTREGYMDMQKELALPDLPRRIAVVTSLTAAGYGDFRKHLLENPEGYAFEVDLYEALMQGEQAPGSIIAAMEKAAAAATAAAAGTAGPEAVAASQAAPYDILVILRGGGSEMDLACFDDYDLAVAIATYGIPVVTAIGHERDFHIADMVANTYVKTPTALADMLLEPFREEDARIEALRTDVLRAVSLRLERENSLIQRKAHRIKFAASSLVSAALSKVELKAAVIKSSDPRNILSMGYVLVTGKDGRVLKTVEKVSEGDRIGVRFSDGSISATVDEVHPGR